MSTTNATSETPVNPLTPLAFLPPDIAVQLENTRLVMMTCIGAFIWEFLSSCRNEYRMWKTLNFRMTDVIYVLSRSLTFTTLILSFLIIVHPFGKCQIVMTTITWLTAIVPALNCLFFVFRATAVYYPVKLAVKSFWLLWIVTTIMILAAAGSVPTGGSLINLGPFALCLPLSTPKFATSGIISSAVHDTLVWVAVSWRLLSSSGLGPTYFKSLLRGRRGMGRVTRTLFMSGQLYYFVAVSANIATVIVMFLPGFPQSYRATAQIVNTTIQNLFACQAYRQLKLGLIRDGTVISLTMRDI
ncbi:hypothetical protein ABKN59_004001 [Abortiporus biennis]